MGVKLTDIVSKYSGQVRTCGNMDCNMMILELYEQDHYADMVGSYDNISDGVRIAKKKTGYASITKFLERDPKYIEIPYGFSMAGDICVPREGHCVFLHLGDYVLLVEELNSVEYFTIKNINKIDKTLYKYYRRL